MKLAGPGPVAAAARAAASAAISLVLLTGAPADRLLGGGAAAAVQPLSAEQRLTAQAWKQVDKNYVDRDFAGQDWFSTRQKMVKKQYDSKEEAYAEIRAMLASLGDKYTRFLTPAMFDAVYSVATGDVAGIGVELAVEPFGAAGAPAVTLSSVVEGGPAAAGGLQPGDALREADGVSLDGLSAEEAAAKVRGAVGSKLRLVAERPGAGEPLVKVLERQTVKLAGVTSSSATVDGVRANLIRVKQFSTATADDVRAALEKDKGAKAYVLDLRGNTGGYFPAGVDVARLFLPKDSAITYTVDRARNVVPYTTYDDGAYTAPLVLLVDGKTASASEVLSSALQDNGRAKLVGSRTFGKAVIQTVEKLDDGSAVVVTIARYETPKRTNINQQGIEVDVAKECPAAKPAAECLPAGLLRS